MKTIIFVMPSLKGGGAERVLVTIANYLAVLNYRVIIALTLENNIEYEINSKIIIEENRMSKKVFNQIKFIRNILKKYKKSTVVSFLTYQNMYTIIANIGLNNKVIISERNDPSKSLRGKVYLNRIREYFYNKADKVVFQSKGAMEYYSKNIQKKGIIINNPLKENLPERYTGKRKNEIVTVSRLEPQKNIELLINSFYKFQKNNMSYILSIYGVGSLETELREKVKKLKIEDKVYFKGFSKDVHEKIKNVKMFVLPSNYEGVSNAMLESLAIGLPTICTDCPPGGARMFIKNGENGFLVPIQNEEKMVNAMEKLAKDDSLIEKFSINGSLIKDKLTQEKICKEWENIIL